VAKQAEATFTTIQVDRTSTVPLQRQLYDGLRLAILSGHLVGGGRLPSTRALAIEVGVSRTTVQLVYEHLLNEGYVEGKVGSGTYVASVLPDTLLQASAQLSGQLRLGKAQIKGGQAAKTAPGLSGRGRVLSTVSPMPPPLPPRTSAGYAFLGGMPALDAFPHALWGRLLARQWRRSYQSFFGYRDPAGYWPLREAVAGYLGAARGVRCSPEQIVIVAGSQQALDLSARLLLEPGDAAWVEDPGYPNARGALAAAGARLVPVPVDSKGLMVEQGVARRADARLAYVTPANQFPLGVSMSLPRRLALLEWAREAGAWIIEDDYDSEYRYAGPPLPALQGIDEHGRVIYVGTFSKVLFPGLRLGYVVLPPDLVDAFTAARLFADAQSPVLEQAVAAEFIAEGHFSRHVRRMRALYADRQAELTRVLHQRLAGVLRATAAEGGMHLVAGLEGGVSDREVARLAAQAGLWAAPLSTFAISAVERPGLLLGFAAVSHVEIRIGVRMLQRVFASTLGEAMDGSSSSPQPGGA